MVRTILIPAQQDISIHLPKTYVGKKIEVLLFATDEPIEELQPKKKSISRFRGALKLSDEQYKDLQLHLKAIREEWE